ncbi:MAG TPA: hypothetical protein PKW55_07670 [Spirochaetota bacterium]|nr:hypothetical protein [Spirochaetota bacterium]HOM38663.1 hypothetical protein [Spirochaetota bacterium]HPQ49821.1 hypothetical protein [Spirochaetota bacterium]
MELLRINTNEIIKIRSGIKNIKDFLKKDNTILVDSYFNIGLFIKKDNHIKKVYIPYGVDKINYGFVIIEVIETKDNKVIIRTRGKDFMEGYKIDKKDLLYYINKYSKYYTTISTEGDILNQEFYKENCIFSIIHFFYQTVSKSTKIKSIAIIKDPSDTLNRAREETENIYNFLSTEIPDIKVSLYNNIDGNTLEKIFSIYNIVHISGHMDEKGLLLKDGYYNPWQQNNLPEFIFLNTCNPSHDFLECLIRRKPLNIVYNNTKISDREDIESIKKFYEGIVAGYRIGDVIKKVFNNKKRVYGWLTNRFIF